MPQTLIDMIQLTEIESENLLKKDHVMNERMTPQLFS